MVLQKLVSPTIVPHIWYGQLYQHESYRVCTITYVKGILNGISRNVVMTVNVLIALVKDKKVIQAQMWSKT